MSKTTGMPLTGGIKDPEVKKVVATLVQHLRERGGEAGDSDERFITKAEFDRKFAELKALIK